MTRFATLAIAASLIPCALAAFGNQQMLNAREIPNTNSAFDIRQWAHSDIQPRQPGYSTAGAGYGSRPGRGRALSELDIDFTSRNWVNVMNDIQPRQPEYSQHGAGYGSRPGRNRLSSDKKNKKGGRAFAELDIDFTSRDWVDAMNDIEHLHSRYTTSGPGHGSRLGRGRALDNVDIDLTLRDWVDVMNDIEHLYSRGYSTAGAGHGSRLGRGRSFHGDVETDY